MQLESLRYLLAIQQAGSVRKAAELLNTSFQNVSKVLKQLETELNTQLFERTPQGMRPTASAHPAIDFAKETLARYDDLLKLYHPAPKEAELTGVISISVVLVTSALLDDVLTKFIPLYPHIQFNFDEIHPYISPAENPNNISLLPRTEPVSPADYEKVVLLTTDKIFALVSKHSPLGRQKSLTLKKFCQQPTVIYSNQGYENSIYDHLLRNKAQLKFTPLITNDSRSYKLYISSGQYIGLTSSVSTKRTLAQDSGNYTLLPIRQPELPIFFYLFIKDTHTLTKAEQVFLDFLVHYFA